MLVGKAILVAVALYFIALGVAALRRPVHARRFLLGFADSTAKHYVEIGARFLVGGSLLLLAVTV
jgi:NADH:ubiquinone oxidoreductase subunit 6 (subunit J)